jgi:DNA-binding response OmpR family regulator
MSKRRLLVVEDDPDIASMLRIFFSNQGYEVQVAGRGSDALALTRHGLPNLIVLDIMLPDMDGYNVCRELRTRTRTSHVPIVFLTQRDERSDRISGLQLGADDYITKPFDIEELGLRIRNAIDRAERDSLTDPRTGLPTGPLIEEQLRRLLRIRDWAMLDCRLEHFEAYGEHYGFVAADEVLREAAQQIGQTLDEMGTRDDFIGHASGEAFVVITHAPEPARLVQRLRSLFDEAMLRHYSPEDRQRGFVLRSRPGGDEAFPFLSLSIGLIRSTDREYTSIREIAEAAAQARQDEAK